MTEPVKIEINEEDAGAMAAFEQQLAEQQEEEEPAAEEEAPKPARKPRRTKDTAPEAPAEQQEVDHGKVRKGTEEFPDDILQAGRFPRYVNDNERTEKALADLREDPVRIGSVVAWELLPDFKGDDAEARRNVLRLALGLDGDLRRAKVDNYMEKLGNTIVFLGVDEKDNLDWLIGTLGDKVVRMRVSKNLAITFTRLTIDELKAYNLGMLFDDYNMGYWQIVTKDDGYKQFRLGDKRAREAAKRKAEREAAKAKREAEKAKAAEKKAATPARRKSATVTAEAPKPGPRKLRARPKAPAASSN